MLKCAQSTRAAPSVEPLTVEDVTPQLRIDYADDNIELRTLITEARMWAEENELGRALITQTVTEKFKSFADSGLELRWPPVQSITSVSYVDTNGDSQTLATTYYELGHHLGVPVCRLKYSQIWPSTRDQEDAVTIVYVAGYGDAASNVPVPIRQAMVAYMDYRYNGGVDEAMLKAARRLLGPYSVRR